MATFLKELSQELGIKVDVNINAGPDNYVHHGHVAISKSTFKEIQYDERFNFKTGEDGRFCRDVLFHFKNSIYVNAKLIDYWRPPTPKASIFHKSRYSVKKVIKTPIRVLKSQFLKRG